MSPRAATGGIDTWRRRDGATTFCGRVKAYGRRYRVLFGTDREGWSAERARAELARIRGEVERGVWTPPGHAAPPPPAEGRGIGAGLTACLYVVQPIGGGPIKVGVSVDPERRLGQLQTGSPVRLELRAVFEVEHPRLVESYLHNRFCTARLWGEWFDAGHPEVAAWLAIEAPTTTEAT